MKPAEITRAMNLIKEMMERNDSQIEKLRKHLENLEEAQREHRRSIVELTEEWFEATRRG